MSTRDVTLLLLLGAVAGAMLGFALGYFDDPAAAAAAYRDVAVVHHGEFAG